MRKNKNNIIIENGSEDAEIVKAGEDGALSIPKTAALVFDRFFTDDTNPMRVVAQRVIIAAALAFLCMGFVFLDSGLPTVGVPFPIIAAGFAAVFAIVFALAGKRVSIIVALILCGLLILWRFDEFWGRFSYFVDGVMLRFNGRLFDTTPYLIHPLDLIERNGLPTTEYCKGVIFGGVLICALFGMITAAGLVGKPCIMPSLVMFVLMLSPKLGSENLMFNWRLIPITALYAGAFAVGIYYRDGLAVRHVYSAGGYRRKVTADRKRFDLSLRSQSMGQRAVSRGLHYSKYFSSMISAAAMFTVAGIVVNIVFSDYSGIDYQAVFETLQSIESPFGTMEADPFKKSAEANYFASPKDSKYSSNNRLRLSAPSRSNKEILRVSKPISTLPLYLRGDIGIEFDGVSWSSPVTEEPSEWSAFRKRWLPIEMSGLENNSALSYMNAEVEYLCDTDVVFVPAYDGAFGVFGDDTLNVFGDFAARRKSDKAEGDKRSYNALVPRYIDGSDWFTEFDMPMLLLKFKSRYGAHVYINEVLSEKLLNEYPNLVYTIAPIPDYEDYLSYVNDNYLSVPEDFKPRLDEYIERSGLARQKEIAEEHAETLADWPDVTDASIREGLNVPIMRYLSAKAVSEYLKENYTYSLDAHIDSRDPVMSFLNNTKSGHCALYASAMTLILREWGIPARYCTGFAASSELSVQTLRSKDLHAWCEVYLDELGWVTFDPTASAIFDGIEGTGPGGAGAESGSDDSESSSRESLSIGGIENDGDDDDDDDDSDDDASADNTHGSSEGVGGSSLTFADVLPYILRILGILAVIAVIVLIILMYNRLKKRANKRIQQFHRDKNSDFVYSKLIAVLRLCKLSPQNGEQPHEFFERAEETMGCEICENYDLFERLAFGSPELDPTETAILGGALERIYKAAERKFIFPGKIRLRLLILNNKV